MGHFLRFWGLLFDRCPFPTYKCEAKQVTVCSLDSQISSSSKNWFTMKAPNHWGHPRCNMIYSFSLFYGPLSGLSSLLRIFCFLCFTSAVSNKLYCTGDEPCNVWENNTEQTTSRKTVWNGHESRLHRKGNNKPKFT